MINRLVTVGKHNILTPRQCLLLVACLLAGIGLVVVTSASMDVAAIENNSAFFYAKRHLIFLVAGLVIGAITYQIPLVFWRKSGGLLLVLSYLLLLLVLIPGVGKTVNGSTRWISLGMINLQVSELTKLFSLIYVAGYLQRREAEIQQSFWGFVKPLLVLSPMFLLLLLQPDFGAIVVIVSTLLMMLFLAGVRLSHFILVILAFAGLAASMVLASQYRMQRILAYTDPWEAQYSSGYQLVQSLIAFGRGEWFGVGLGNSIQKLFFLPEAHTDFIFAIMAEEFGFFGNALVIAAFMGLVWVAMGIGRKAQHHGLPFNTYLIYGVGTMIGLQALVNMGVSSGLLPTKGLTLPLLSYGGSSLIVVCIMIALVMRADYENQRIDSSVQSNKRPLKRDRSTQARERLA